MYFLRLKVQGSIKRVGMRYRRTIVNYRYSHFYREIKILKGL